MRIPERWLTRECIAAACGEPPKARGIQVFANAFFDVKLASAHPGFPALFFLPIAAACLVFAASRAGFVRIGGLALVGWLSFSLVEYLVHRFLFHRRFPDTQAGRIEWFLTHGYHHDYPNDPMRLVLPPMGSIPLAMLFAAAFVAALGPVLGAALFAGFVVGYVVYDTSHYLLHHARWKNPAFVWLRRYHLLHHHVDTPGRFGVSSPLWDLVFGTFGPVGRAAREQSRATTGARRSQHAQ